MFSSVKDNVGHLCEEQDCTESFETVPWSVKERDKSGHHKPFVSVNVVCCFFKTFRKTFCAVGMTYFSMCFLCNFSCISKSSVAFIDVSIN